MSHAIDTYKRFIDRLVDCSAGVERLNVIEHSRFSPKPADATCNLFVSRLSMEDREVLAGMLEHARHGGIHDALAVMQEFRDIAGLEFAVSGEPIPVSPLGTEMQWDFVARAQGESWPDE